MALKVKSTENETDLGGPKFQPPLYKQRYSFVSEVLRNLSVKYVADFGCADAKFFQHAKGVENVENLLGIDIDKDDILSRTNCLKPFPSDYIIPSRCEPLDICLYVGSITEFDSRLIEVDCVTMIEVIEHLESDNLIKFPEVIFNEINPKFVVITTPNCEYNVLFPNFSGFRHWDHKFEWSREEFQTWSRSICEKFDYTVEFNGVGEPLPEREEVGFCSQIAIFTRCSDNKKNYINEDVHPYEMVFSTKHPGKRKIDDIDAEIVNQATYHIHRVAFNERTKLKDGLEKEESSENYDLSDEDDAELTQFKFKRSALSMHTFECYFDEEEIFKIKIPLNLLQELETIMQLCPSLDKLKNLLEDNGYEINDLNEVLYQLKTYSSSSEDPTSDDEIMNDDFSNSIETNNFTSIQDNDSEENWDSEENDITEDNDVQKNKRSHINVDVYDKTHTFCHFQDYKCQKNLTCMKTEDIFWAPLSEYQEYLMNKDRPSKCSCKNISKPTMDNIDGIVLCMHCHRKQIIDPVFDGQFSDVEDVLLKSRPP